MSTVTGPRATLAAAALACAAGCQGTTGTIALELTTAPGSTVLDAVTRLRLTLTDPLEITEVERSARGFDLSLGVEAGGESAALIVEGFDAGGALVATGMSPRFAVAPIDAKIVIYIAAPLSIAAAPVALAPARSEVAGVGLAYGALFAGGRDAAGVPSTAIAIYNAYDHTLTSGAAMPVARTRFAIAGNASGGVYLLGGVGTDGGPVPSVVRFETTVAPAGTYTAFGDQPAFAPADQALVQIAADRFLLTGAAPAELAAGTLAARADLPSLPAIAASVVPADGVRTAVFVGEGGLVRFRDGQLSTLAGTGRGRASITSLTSGDLVIAGGGTATTPSRDLLVVDPETGTVTPHADALATGRFLPAMAATDRYVVIAGGVDAAGQPVASAEVLDATTLAPVATLAIAPRTDSRAFSLPNGQVLIAGGAPANDLLELFTPPPPP